MGPYLIRRLLSLIPVILGITILAFGLANLTPGDPAEQILYRSMGIPPSEAEIQAKREELGLNDPLPVQYGRWLVNLFRGDLGTSYRFQEPVLTVLFRFFPNTLQLTLAAIVVTIVVAIPLGLLAALFRNTWVDQVARLGSLLGASLPVYWLGYLLIILFAVKLQWLPVAGRGSFAHLILPALALGLAAAAIIARLLRSTLLEVLGEDYIRTARAKGASEYRVILGHALRNALLPIVTILGIHFAHLLGGTVIVEVVFAWPGLGQTVIEGIFDRDYPLIQGFVLFMGIVFVLVNLVVDITYTWIDPRVQLTRTIGPSS
jgi:peptide/nickel transport system permease protein